MSQTELNFALKPWQIILLSSALLSLIYGLGTFFFDFFAGSATEGFGIQGQVPGMGMFFLYMIGYLNALVVILPILLIKRFGVGMAVYLLIFFPGSLIDLYFEWIEMQALRAPWAAFGWGIVFLAVGLSADLTYRLLPARLSERLRAILVGMVMACATFLLTLVALNSFYVIPMPTGPGSFLGVAYFGLPWMIVHSGFGGYTAYALSQKA